MSSKSDNVFRALLLLYLGFCRWLRRKLEDGSFLTLEQMGHENDSPARKFKRIMVQVLDAPIDLSEDCGRVALCSPPPPDRWPKCHFAGKRELGSRKDANRHCGIFRCAEPARA
jgi:hypothetical protein